MDDSSFETICDIYGHQYSGGICTYCYDLEKCEYCGYKLDHKFCEECDRIICNRCKLVKYETTTEGNYICRECKKNK